ncbi:hypothetical protein EF405_00320 [Cyclobacteriaceae bacterium YHN15]|nr:hypothetical protein EF405_00320 [Cyclobacteriaceae bacterium YHN15]
MTLTRRIRILFFFLLITSTSKGTEHYLFGTDPVNFYRINGFSFLPEGLNLDFLDSLNKVYHDKEKSYSIFKSQKGYMLHVRCTFDLFRLSENGIENLYKFDNRGYNCNTALFERDGRIYSQGGYGFWNYHSDLMVLDEENGSWEFVKTINQPLNFTGRRAILDSGLLVLFGSYKNVRTELNKIENHGWFLDWESKTWNRIKIKIDGADIADFRSADYFGTINLKDYLFFGSEKVNIAERGLYFIDKNSLEISFLQRGNLDFYKSPYIQVIDNTIYFQNLKGVHQTLDISLLQKKADKVGHIEIIKSSGSLFDRFKYPFLVLFALSVFLLIPFLNRKLRKKEPEKESTCEEPGIDVISATIKKLSAISGQTLAIDDLDSILGIQHIPNLDNRRVRRSRMITDINTNYRFSNGKNLINRVKKPDDKRYTYYIIEL